MPLKITICQLKFSINNYSINLLIFVSISLFAFASIQLDFQLTSLNDTLLAMYMYAFVNLHMSSATESCRGTRLRLCNIRAYRERARRRDTSY